MAEALATAQTLGGAIAVSIRDVGPNLKAAAEHDAPLQDPQFFFESVGIFTWLLI
jgi:hypothetical protein